MLSRFDEVAEIFSSAGETIRLGVKFSEGFYLKYSRRKIQLPRGSRTPNRKTLSTKNSPEKFSEAWTLNSKHPLVHLRETRPGIKSHLPRSLYQGASPPVSSPLDGHRELVLEPFFRTHKVYTPSHALGNQFLAHFWGHLLLIGLTEPQHTQRSAQNSDTVTA